MRRGVRLGIDPGSVRVGVSVCDPDGILATPLTTVGRAPGDPVADVAPLVELAAERELLEIVVGLPLSLSGVPGKAVAASLEYAHRVAAAVAPVPVRLVDERLTTVSATSKLRQAGKNAKRGRGVVDQAAATIVLQHALDMERSTGRPPGDLVEQGEGTHS